MGGDGIRSGKYVFNRQLKSTPPAWAGTVFASVEPVGRDA